MKSYQNLLQLLAINSKTNTELGGANIEGTKKAVMFIQELIKELPLKWTEIKKDNVSSFWYAETIINDPTKPTILISSHIDTVYSAKDIVVKETSNKIYGSGAQDMKGSVYAICEILKKLHAKKQLRNLIFYISPQEETATLDYRDEIGELVQRANYAMVFESTMDFEPNGAENKRSLVVSRKGFDMFDVDIFGPGGHSGVISSKHERQNAILKAAEIIMELENIADYSKETTLNTGFIHGGDAINVLATHIKFSFETRFRTLLEYERVKRDLTKLFAQKINKPFNYKIKSHKFYPPFDANEVDNKFFELCQQVGSLANIEVVPEKRGGGSEASLIKYFNPRCAVLDGFGLRGEGQHTKEEFIYKYSLDQTIDFAENVILRIMQSTNN